MRLLSALARDVSHRRRRLQRIFRAEKAQPTLWTSPGVNGKRRERSEILRSCIDRVVVNVNVNIFNVAVMR